MQLPKLPQTLRGFTREVNTADEAIALPCTEIYASATAAAAAASTTRRRFEFLLVEMRKLPRYR